MSDKSEATPVAPHVWYTGYINGVKASFTLPLGSDELAEEAIDVAVRALEKLKAKGFAAQLPGLGQGEGKSPLITSVLRRQSEKGDPIIVFYSGDSIYKWWHTYLNKERPQDTQSFLTVSGLRGVTDVPLYEGGDYPDRTKQVGQKYIVNVPKPFYVVRRDSGKKKPMPDGKGEYTVYYLSRFEHGDGTPAESNENPFANASTNGAAEPAQEKQDFTIVRIETDLSKSKTVAYRLIAKGGERIYHNSRKPFTDVGYAVSDQQGAVFDVPGAGAFITAIKVLSGDNTAWNWYLDTSDPHPVIPGEAAPDHEIPL